MLKRENVLYNLSKNIYFEIHKSWAHFICMCLSAAPFQLFWKRMNIYFLQISFQIGLFESWGIKNECPIPRSLQKKNINSANGHSTCFSLWSHDFSIFLACFSSSLSHQHPIASQASGYGLERTSEAKLPDSKRIFNNLTLCPPSP